MNRDDIIAANPLLDYCEARGWQLRRDGTRWKCLCPLHEEKTPSFTISPEKKLWHCFGCDTGGSVIDLHAKLRGISIAEAMRELSQSNGSGSNGHHRPKAKPSSSNAVPRKEVACYDYEDATGRTIFQVVRYEPKGFTQCRIVDGERVWNMEGVERLPYRLPELLCHPLSIWVVEGEKDVETLRSIGQTATCNPGGAGKWLPAFSQYLKDRCVYICPDRDEPGEKHGREVLKSLERLVEWVKWIELPLAFKGASVKDITDLRQACGSNEEFSSELELLQRKARLIERGIDSRSFSMVELEAAYISEKTVFGDVSIDLDRWLPELELRPLGPSDVLGIVAGTGQLKTAVVQNILACNADIPALLFELELSGPQMFERGAAISTRINAWEISRIYDRNESVNWRKAAKFKNLLVCTSSMSMKDIDEEIARASAKLGCLPKVFVIDYAQLIRGKGTRYERMSEACEETKRLAKKWNAIAIIISQISRKKDDPADNGEPQEVGLFDAKESGSFENSCNLVLGIWKTARTEMRCRVLKNSKGYSGKEVSMRIVDNTYIIEPA